MLKKKRSAATSRRRTANLRRYGPPRGSAGRIHAPEPAAGLPEQVMLEHLFEATLDGNIIVDERGVIVLTNRQAERMFGYPPGGLAGRPITDLIPDDRREKHDRLLADYMRDPTPRPMAVREAMRLELFARRADGSVFPVEISLNPVRTRQGLFVVSTVRDISQRQEIENERRIQADLVRLLQDVAVAANEADSVTGALQFTVNRLCRFLGWRVGHAYLLEEDQALTSTTIWAGDLPEQMALFKAVSEALRYSPGYGLPGRVLESGQPVWVPRVWEADGFTRSAEAQNAGLVTGLFIPVIAGKQVVGVLELYSETEQPPDPNLMAVLPHVGVQIGRVIERKRAEEALHKQTMQLRMLMTYLPVILWVTDREGRLLLMEGKGVKQAEVSPQELIGQNIFTLLKDRADVTDLLRRALAGEEIHTEVASSTGAVFETFLTPYYDVNWAVDGIVALSFDVSERKRMESELDEMRHRLMESMDIERARLAQQLHDGPLQDLYGAFYQMQEVKNALDGQYQELAARVLQTIHGVNATLRVICGELHPNTLVHLGLQRAIRGHADRLQERLGGVVILLDLADDSPSTGSILSHNLRLGLYRIYQQLITNAVRHASAQHIWVRLKLPPGQAILEVEDNGQGFKVPDHWIELVREGRFGLVSTIERVQSLDGRLDFESSPGSGTLVRVTVPVKDAPGKSPG